MKLIELPKEVRSLLEELDAPPLLNKHLTIVYSTAFELLSKIKAEWPEIKIKEALVLFGAATHDIGKTVKRKELYAAGKEHELEGYKMLIKHNYSIDYSRFAKTHGNWNSENLALEDLLVIVADKIWKGKRIDELEERLIKKLANNLDKDYWEIFTRIDELLSEISLGADERIAWQRK